MARDNGQQVIERLRKIIERNEQRLAYFQNRLKQAQFIDRPNQRLINTAGVQADAYTDQLAGLEGQLRALEQFYGGGVGLRTTAEADVRRIWRWTTEPMLCRILGTEPIALQTYIDNWRRWLADEDCHPLSVDLPTGELLGFLLIQCTGRAWEDRRAQLEFIIIRPDCRYRGYGTVATRRAIDYAFEHLGVDSFGVQVSADNYAAFLCFERNALQCVDREYYSGAETYNMALRREVWENPDAAETAAVAEIQYDAANEPTNSYAMTLFGPLKDLVSNG